MASLSPKSPESDKSRKYDRQIRLWGEHGQSVLESSRVCLVNATGVGCEILKSLVLPGIGGFTIVDGSTVIEEDLGINFFLDTSSVGTSKAAACTKLLQELNGDASGDYVEESINHIMEHRPTFFESFNLVIATNLNEKNLLELSNCLWDANIPFIYCRSLGFFGSIRLQIKEHCIVETHPDNRPHDLRLEHPFPTLQQHFEATPVTNKVPWLIVLNKYFQEWKKETNKTHPTSFAEKKEIRAMIERDYELDDNENYEEAMKAVNTSFGGGEVPPNVRAIFDDEACANLTKQSDLFWIMARSLKDFVEKDNNGLLPLPGILPDMTADTEFYINLQNIYRQQALQDADNVYRRCQSYINDLGLPEETLCIKTVRLFCRESSGLCVMRGTKISDEYEKNTRIFSIIDLECTDNLADQYLIMRAYERFLFEFGNIPGDCYVENDTARLKSIASKMVQECGAQIQVDDDIIHEVCRYGGTEVHTVSAFIGGCAAHEVIKILTKQYKPIDNIYLYNGMTGETTTFKL